jgi:hypothetical protein
MKQMNDLAIEQIREARRRISAAQGHDAEKLVSYYIELQKKFQQRSKETQEAYVNQRKPNKSLGS